MEKVRLRESWVSSYPEDVVITKDNVKDLGEMIGFKAIKKVYDARPHKYYERLYYGAISDIYRNKGINHVYSDAYDYVQTAICFLLEHVGKRLNDVIGYKCGKPVTIKLACYRKINLQLVYFEKYHKNTVSVNALTHDPYAEFNEVVEPNYTAVDETIEKMHLTQGEYETLCCYMGGMQFVEIARFLSVQTCTIWRRRMAIQRKYLALQRD